ncbi:MAG: hypothetical protein WBO44_09540, partial [Saprospiraceae bacterium]
MKTINITLLALLLIISTQLISQINPNVSKIDPVKTKSIPQLVKNVNLEANWYLLEGTMSQIDAQNGAVWA